MTMMKIDSEWFKGLNKTEIEERKKFLASEQKVLDILRKIVYNIRTSQEIVSENDYDSPSWSHKQAHLNGESSALRRIERLLTFNT